MTNPQPAKKIPCQSTDTIGIAHMDNNGTIELKLRIAEKGIVGDTILTYTKEHPQYVSILAHLQNLKPGDYKPVPPWPEN